MGSFVGFVVGYSPASTAKESSSIIQHLFKTCFHVKRQIISSTETVQRPTFICNYEKDDLYIATLYCDKPT